MRATVLLSMLALAACESPPFALRFRLTDGPSLVCTTSAGVPTTSCADITMVCDAYLSVRILPPRSSAPYISHCERLEGSRDQLCAIAGVELPMPTVPVPEQVLEVQMAVFPESAITFDPASGDPICPIARFADDGMPENVEGSCNESDPLSCPKYPAVGGRTYYYPGDDKTVVTLGCSDLEQLRGALCTGANRITVNATVNDFDNPNISVTSTTADDLRVSIGEQVSAGTGYRFGNETQLVRVPMSPTPVWSAELDGVPQTAKCVQVLEDIPQATASLACSTVRPEDADGFDATGYRLSRELLQDILFALGEPNGDFPAAGLVVGIVMSSANTPVAGATIEARSANMSYEVKYLSANRQSVTTGSTSSNGIFLSKTAPFGSVFTWNAVLKEGFGGLVQNNVTIVVIRENMGTGGGI